MAPAQLLVWTGAVLGLFLTAQAAAAAWQATLRAARLRTQERNEAALLAEKLVRARESLRLRETGVPWNGARKFRIIRVAHEAEGVKSFYLAPHDKRPLPAFLPGQYLTFELDIPGERKRSTRCYSLSDRPGLDHYRVTIKAVPAPPENPGVRPGLVSNHFHAALKEGDIVDVKAPSGGFHLDTERNTPAVLIAGGVGVTPMASMLKHIAASQPDRDAWLFYGVRNGAEHIFRTELEGLAKENERLRLHVCFSKPGPDDAAGRDYRHKGHVTVGLLQSQLPSNNYEFYLCGPGRMMQDMHDGLLAWGVPEASIHLEAFGPASVKKSSGAAQTTTAAGLKVRYSKSGRELEWTGEADSLLDMALKAQIPVDFGCRAGSCGACRVAVKSGAVKYLKQPGCEVETGSCLTCISVPETALELEA
jgi:uncharacterized protein